jgi:hypothetical protein
MRLTSRVLTAVAGTFLLAGCVVREERPHRRVYVYGPPPPAEVVYTDAPPPAPVEVVPVAPGPDVVWVDPVYIRVEGHWVLHHGYYRHR